MVGREFDGDATLSAAYASCARIARDHYENFPVASWLLPRGMRPHVAAIYAFARTADDFADEGTRPPSERLRLLDEWLGRLEEAAAGRVDQTSASADVFRALAHTMRACGLPQSLFADLISAFKQDVTTTRYPSWASVLDYCRRSANPVGRLVLRVAGKRDEALDRASDDVCTALQLTNFWQDLAVDWSRGRLYVPLDEVAAAGALVEDLDRRAITPPWRAVLAAMVDRTRVLFEAGRHVCDEVSGRLRWELRLTWLGGVRILERLERSDFDVFDRRPTLGAADVGPMAWRAMGWSRAARAR